MQFVTPDDAKKSMSLKIVYTVNVIISSMNIVFDYYLIKATIKNKSLHKPCPILIGIYFLCQLLYTSSVFITYAIIIMPSPILDSITMQTCAMINFAPVTAYYGTLSLTFVISFDRFLSIYFPLWYSLELSAKCHILFLSIFSGLIPFYASIMIVQSGIKYGNITTLCTMAELLRDQLTFQGQFSMCINVGIIILNLAIFSKFIWRKFYKSAITKGVSPVDLQVLKAVALILCVQISTWLFGMTFFTFYFNVINLDSMKRIERFQIVIISGIISSTLLALEVPILYFTSSLHRAALKKEFNWLPKCFSKNNQVKNVIFVKPATLTID